MTNIEKLLEVMAALRTAQSGCPWDLQQDFRSIAPYTVEEAYEVADAIARDDMPGLRDELGDLLFQVVFHARMAEEAGHFDFSDVAGAICEKMRRRHPHVFGDESERSSGAVPGSWERIKAAERQGGTLDGVALALPALKRAEKLGKRAARVGFDWPDKEGVKQKIHEEMAEVDEAVTAARQHEVAEEVGDLLFAVVNLARHLRVDPEQALDAANRKFERRFRRMEAVLQAAGEQFAELDIEALEQRWQVAKKA